MHGSQKRIPVGAAAIPGDEEFHTVGIANEGTCQQDDLIHILDMTDGNEVFEVKHDPARNGECNHHRESREDRTRDEVRREDCSVPTGDDRRCEVEGNHRVYREYEWCRKRGENEVRALVVIPVACSATPTHREDAVNHPSKLGLCAVPEGRKVGHEADVPENQRHGEVGRNRENVPQERTSEVRPHRHLIW